jgi:hypothetical protein
MTLTIWIALLSILLSVINIVYVLRNIIASWIIRMAQKTPYFHLEGYMLRWWLWQRREWKWLYRWPRLGYPFRCAARVHQILRSDDDRHAHDHPCWSISVILRNGYKEWLPPKDRRNFVVGRIPVAGAPNPGGEFDEPMVCKVHNPFDIVFRRATDRHRLELLNGKPVTTVFIMGPWVQDWGFYIPNWGKVYWRKYLEQWSGE